MINTEDIWIDIRRYEWNSGSLFYDIDEISEIIFRLDGLEVSRIPVRYDIDLGFYVVPENLGVEFTLYDDSHFNFVRSKVVGRSRPAVTSFQESLEKIIQKRGYITYASHAANPQSDPCDFLGKAYGGLTSLGLRF